MRGVGSLALSLVASGTWLSGFALEASRVAPTPETDSLLVGLRYGPYLLAAIAAGLLFLFGVARLASASEVRGTAYQLVNGALWSFVVAALALGASVLSPLLMAVALLLGVPVPEGLLAHGLARTGPAGRLERGLAWAVTALLVALSVLSQLGDHPLRLPALVATRLATLALLLVLLLRARRAAPGTTTDVPAST